ncbi:MAG: hypothetical protein R2822_18505 [Spirosomataceae bacterium]
MDFTLLFVYDLYQSVIKKDIILPDFEDIEHIRRQMLHSSNQLHVTDYGAGSKVNGSLIRKVSDIANNSKNRHDWRGSFTDLFSISTITLFLIWELRWG